MLFFERTKDTYDVKNDKPVEDGEHLFIITKLIGPKESKRTAGRFFYHFVFESCECGGEIIFSIGCNADGFLLNGKEDGFMGQGKFNALAEALGLQMGKVSVDSIIGGVVKGLVETKNGYRAIDARNLWTPTDEERDRAARYDIEKGA
jgi:hypothetical protein